MTDTVIPNAELRKAASDLLGALKADGYPDQSVLAELQQLADGQPMPKKVINEEWIYKACALQTGGLDPTTTGRSIKH